MQTSAMDYEVALAPHASIALELQCCYLGDSRDALRSRQGPENASINRKWEELTYDFGGGGLLDLDVEMARNIARGRSLAGLDLRVNTFKGYGSRYVSEEMGLDPKAFFQVILQVALFKTLGR